MANWVFNYLTVKLDYLDKIVNMEGKVDFNIIAPKPTSVDGLLHSVGLHTDIYYYLSGRLKKPLKSMMRNKLLLDSCKISDQSTVYPWEGEIPSGMSVTEFKVRQLYKRTLKAQQTTYRPSYNRGRTLVCDYRRYGAISWYDWSWNNWGCKWNASNTYVPEKADESGKLIVEFDTPWCCPDKWLERLCEHGVPFCLEWVEEQGEHGEVISDGKTITFNSLPDVSWEEDSDEDEADDVFGTEVIAVAVTTTQLSQEDIK